MSDLNAEEYKNFEKIKKVHYGGLTVDEIHKRKNLKEKDKILDFFSQTDV